jgi:S-(hydroxymethyl)glutathione dehydrogenase/alcohol dehydrogenase
VEEGASVAVWGCGGVGLNVVQAARLAGARPIVAVDTRPEKLRLAERLGATHAVEAAPETDPVAAVRELTDGGVDYAFEAIGREATIREAWDALRPGGTAVVLGLPPKGSTLTVDTWGFINEKTLKGSFLGSADIGEDVPRIVDLYAAGELNLDDLVSARLGLADLPAALERLRRGDALRQLVVFA